MKNRFKQHHILEELDNIYSNSIIVLDTNSILNLYRYNTDNRDKYLEILKKVSDRIYLTHQIGLEFYKNRLRIIEDRSTFKDSIKEMISENQNKLLNVLNNFSGGDSKYNSSLSILKHENDLKESLSNSIKKSLEEIEQTVDDFKQDLDISYIQESDPILEEIISIIGEKVHDEFSKEDLEKIYKEGENRFSKKIPPGYKDTKKEDTAKYNDYVIWREIIDLSKSKKTNILLISDDRKEDWAEISRGKDFGPRKELVKEFLDLTENLFYSITTKKFIEVISSKYDVKNTEHLIKETESIIENARLKESIEVKESKSKRKSQEEMQEVFNNWLALNTQDKKQENELFWFDTANEIYKPERKTRLNEHFDLFKSPVVDSDKYSDYEKDITLGENNDYWSSFYRKYEVPSSVKKGDYLQNPLFNFSTNLGINKEIDDEDYMSLFEVEK